MDFFYLKKLTFLKKVLKKILKTFKVGFKKWTKILSKKMSKNENLGESFPKKVSCDQNGHKTKKMIQNATA